MSDRDALEIDLRALAAVLPVIEGSGSRTTTIDVPMLRRLYDAAGVTLRSPDTDRLHRYSPDSAQYAGDCRVCGQTEAAHEPRDGVRTDRAGSHLFAATPEPTPAPPAALDVDFAQAAIDYGSIPSSEFDRKYPDWSASPEFEDGLRDALAATTTKPQEPPDSDQYDVVIPEPRPDLIFESHEDWADWAASPARNAEPPR